MSDELGAHDLRRALDVVLELNDDRGGELPAAALAELGALVGSDVTACARIDRMTGRTLAVLTDRPDESVMNHPRFDGLVHQHPVCVAYHAGRLPLGTSAALTDLAELSALRGIPLYADLYRPSGIVDELMCPVRVSKRQLAALSFTRSRFGFSRRDRAVADVLAPHVAQALARHRRARAESASTAWPMLTPRQREVTEQVSRGATDREIARNLGISPRTVHKHLEQIYRRLGLTNRTGLMALLADRRL